MKSYLGIILYKLFPESVGNFFDNTIFGKLILWLIPIFIILWILFSIYFAWIKLKEGYVNKKSSKGYNSGYKFGNYIIEIIKQWWFENKKGIIRFALTVFLIFLPIILVIIYGISKGIF